MTYELLISEKISFFFFFFTADKGDYCIISFSKKYLKMVNHSRIKKGLPLELNGMTISEAVMNITSHEKHIY